MAITKFLAGLTVLVVSAAVVTALAGVGPDGKATAAKTDRVGGAASAFACAPEPWPYGCQWREPATPRRWSRSGR